MSGPSDEDVANSTNAATPATPAIPASAASVAAPTTPASESAAASPAVTTPSFFDRYKMSFIVGVLILAAIAVGFGLGRIGRNADKNQSRLVLYGNVDLRQVNLSFNDSERIAEVLVQEGAKVRGGRFWPGWIRVGSAGSGDREAVLEAQQAVVDRLHHAAARRKSPSAGECRISQG